jgi:hypothetical protein
MEQITKAQLSSRAVALVELNPSQLQLVSGGLPKGTWLELLSLTKGSLELSLPKGTW